MPGKRSNGEGALRKRSSGLWECMIMTGFQPNGKREYKSFYARTRKEVLQKVRDYRAAIEAGLDMTKKELKFGEWAQSWYEGYKDQVSPTTYESYGYTLKTLNRAFGSKPLRSIRTSDVEAFLRDLTKDGTHQSQASKCRGMMFQIMRKAQANDLILKNPVELADKSRHAPQKSKKDSFTAEEVRKLFKFLPHDKTGDSIRLLLLTGMRSQELLALEAGHIEPDGSCVHIRQAVKQVKGVRPLTPHSCRHTFVSQLQAQGVPMETIQSLAGHADVDMTEHYLHVQDGVKATAVERLAGLICS